MLRPHQILLLLASLVTLSACNQSKDDYMAKYYGNYDLSVRWIANTPTEDMDSSYVVKWALNDSDDGSVTIPLSGIYTLSTYVDKDGLMASYEPLDSSRIRENVTGGFVGVDSVAFTVDFVDQFLINSYSVTGHR